MRKILLTAVVVMATASSFAQTLKSTTDSLSYAAGITMTDGLLPYLKQSFGVDSTQMADFLRGFEEAVNKAGDNKFKAYMAGQQIAQMVQQRMLPDVKGRLEGAPDSINTKVFLRGFTDALRKSNASMDKETASTYFQNRMEANQEAKNERLYGANRRAGEQFLANNAKQKGVVTLPSGLQYKELVKGTGAIPTQSDEVVVKYEGKLVDGTVFDSSYERKEQTNKFRPSQVIKGWTEALTKMPVGSKWQIFVPYQLAYGERDMGKIKPYSALIFTIELIGIEKTQN
ncbi:MAG: FKBP-type peptidyl-prolyl cis-trans isomerase [Prevotella sp.]|nr:FKBP-type peptidyl-prolyl cis-trans isomerase [Prevotella sp.]